MVMTKKRGIVALSLERCLEWLFEEGSCEDVASSRVFWRQVSL